MSNNVIQHPRLVQENVDELRVQRAALIDEITKLTKEHEKLQTDVQSLRDTHQSETRSYQTIQERLSDEVKHLKNTEYELKNLITQHEHKRRQLEQEIEAKNRSCVKFETESAQASMRAAESRQQIEQAQVLWNDLIKNIEADTVKLEALKSDVQRYSSLAQQVLQLEERKKILSDQCKHISQNKEEIEGQEAAFKSRIGKIESHLEQLKSDELEKEKKLSTLNSDLQKAENHRSHILAEIELLKQSIEMQKAIFSQETKKIQESQAEYQANSARAQSAKGRLELLEGLVRNKEFEVQRFQQEQEHARTLLAEVRLQTAEREKRLDVIADRLNELTVEMRTRESKLQTIKQHEEETQKNYDALIIAQSQAERKISEYQSTIFNLSKTRDQEFEKLKMLREQFNELGKQRDDKLKQIKIFQAQHKELEQQAQALAQEVIQARKHREEQMYDASLLEQQHKARHQALAELTEQWTRVQSDLQDCVARRNQLEVDIAQNVQLLHEKSIECDRLKEQELSYQNKISETQKLVEKHRIELSDLQLQVQSEAQEKRRWDLLLKEVEQRYKAEEQRVRDVLDRSEQLRKQETSTVQRISDLRRNEDELIITIDGRRKELSDLENKKRKVEADVSDEKKKFEQVEIEIHKAMEKHATIAAAIKTDTDNLLSLRHSIRELEEHRGDKLRELQGLREEIQLTSQKYTEMRSRTLENQSVQVRTEAERTLLVLRRRIERALSDQDKSESA